MDSRFLGNDRKLNNPDRVVKARDCLKLVGRHVELAAGCPRIRGGINHTVRQESHPPALNSIFGAAVSQPHLHFTNEARSGIIYSGDAVGRID